MESSRKGLVETEAAQELAAIESTRTRFAAELVVPPYHDVIMGVAVAVQIATAAIGITADESSAGLVLMLGGLLAFYLAAGAELRRFRHLNGVGLSGFVHKATFGVTWVASLGYGAAIAAAIVSANAGVWWLVAVASVFGAGAWVLASTRWMRRYRAGIVDASAGGARTVTIVSVVLGILVAALLIISGT